MYSPFSETVPSSIKSENKRINSPYLSPSVRRTPLLNSRKESLGPSFITSMLNDSYDYCMEGFGSNTPVLVMEAFTTTERSTDISVKLESFGYASLVYGRQLLIWKFNSNKNMVHCKELILPPSDLAHKADLVHLFQSEDSQILSALAVSPEGHVRYWPNINHEGSSVDAQPDLQGQECCSLTSVWPLGCVLATTSSSLVILMPSVGEGQHTIICHPLTLPVGVLTGFSRRVSSFIFGSIPAQTAETKQLSRVLSVSANGGDYFLYVLGMNTLQKWRLTKKDQKESSDQLVFEIDLDRELKRCFSEELLKNDVSVPYGDAVLKTWCLDVQPCQTGVLILAAGTKVNRPSSIVHYAFCLLDTNSDCTPQGFSQFYLSTFQEPYQKETEEKILSYRLLLPSVDSTSAFIYNSEKVLSFQYNSPDAEFSEMNFSNSSNAILGSGTCEGKPLFFINTYGIVSFLPNKPALSDSKLIASAMNVSILPSDPNEPTGSFSAKLRTAMCSFFSGDREKCESLLNEILGSIQPQDESELDKAVVTLSEGIIDDYPVSDPRWCESIPTGSVSSSLIISYQLDDKLKAHGYLVNFLEAFHLLEKLKTIKVSDNKILTKLLLLEHREKIIAAKTIRMFLSDHCDVIEYAVQNALDRRSVPVKVHLTPQDVFFREVSMFHTIFSSILMWEEEQLNADDSVTQKLNAILAVNKVFVGILECIIEHRNKETQLYKSQNDVVADFLPWTFREGTSGIRSEIKYQLELNIKHSLDLTGNIQIQGVLYQQYIVMLSFYLNDYRSCIMSAKKEQAKTLQKHFQKESVSLLRPLVDIGQYERAAALAEEFLVFDILLEICEKSQNVDRLQRYMLQFKEHNFSEFVFKWYFDQGQKGKIFAQNFGERDALGKFLQNHDELKWLYFVQEEMYNDAHITLKQLALKETEFLYRKKTLLSLSKICAMLSDVSPSTKTMQIEGINLEHDLITHQEALPISVVEAYVIDQRNMRVFPPEELIEMYIAEENTTANAYDFKIALDLLSFMKKPMDDPEVYNIRKHIWAKAVLRDNWEAFDVNSPLDAIKEAIFFQIIELACDQGLDVHEFLPLLDDLLQEPELTDLSENPYFKFLLQAGYEYVFKIVS